MAADEIEMQTVVLQMLQQQRMVQRQLELVLQEMNLLLDEARPRQERIWETLRLQDQVLQMLHQQGQIQNHLRLALLKLAVTHGLRDDAVAAEAAQAVLNRLVVPQAPSGIYSSSANSQSLVDAEDASQPPEAPTKTGTAAQHATVDEA
jgi:hypothetical protein